MKKFSITFVTVGALLLCVTAFLFSKQQSFLSTAIATQGSVVQLLTIHKGGYTPLVRFETSDGEVVEVTAKSSSSPPLYDLGEKVTVYYQSYDPEGAQISGFFSMWWIHFLLGGIGTLFVLVGAVFMIPVGYNPRILTRLKQTGIAVEAKVSDVYLNELVTYNGLHPFQVSAKWMNPQSGEEVTFLSADLWSDPTEQLASEYVTVFIDRKKPERYFMDLPQGGIAASQKPPLA